LNCSFVLLLLLLFLLLLPVVHKKRPAPEFRIIGWQSQSRWLSSWPPDQVSPEKDTDTTTTWNLVRKSQADHAGAAGHDGRPDAHGLPDESILRGAGSGQDVQDGHCHPRDLQDRPGYPQGGGAAGAAIHLQPRRVQWQVNLL